MKEEWRDINDYEGLYQVSNLGNIKTLSRLKIMPNGGKCYTEEKVLKPGITTGGYYYVTLYKNKKTKHYDIHRLVAIAFVDGYKEGLVVNHIDECKTNNIYTNLEWVTHQENILYSRENMIKNHADVSGNKNPKAKKVRCVETDEIFETISEANKSKGITGSSSISKSIKRNGTCGGYHWEYVEQGE